MRERERENNDLFYKIMYFSTSLTSLLKLPLPGLSTKSSVVGEGRVSASPHTALRRTRPVGALLATDGGSLPSKLCIHGGERRGGTERV